MLAALLLLGAVAAPGAAGSRNLARGMVREDDTLLVDAPSGPVRIALAGWEPVEGTTTELIALSRTTDAGTELRLLDRRGQPLLATLPVPAGWDALPSDAGIVLLPSAPHGPERPHWLRFLSIRGDELREVHEPALRLLSRSLTPNGRLVTVSADADGTAWTVLVYDAGGAETWRHVVSGAIPPDAVVTPDGRRLAVLERDLEAGTATITVLASGRPPQRHRLPNVTGIVADAASSRIAVVGQRVVAMIDADSGKLAWRRDEPVDLVLHGGLRFDRHGPRLLVVSADRDRAAGNARLRLRMYRLRDGAAKHAALGVTGLDELPSVVDVDAAPGGGRRVVLDDRAVTSTPETSSP